MREWLRDPWYWVRYALRWSTLREQWREALVTFGIVWTILTVALLIVNLI